MASASLKEPAAESVGEPVLEKPGAGVPRVERFVGKWVLRMQTVLGGRGGADARFGGERVRIEGLCRSLSEARAVAQGSSRVLIPRLRGLEDSSRYWSVWMTLEHLAIVNEQIAGVIVSLVRGKVLAGQASTAAVKPSRDVDERVVARFEQSCERVVRSAARPANLRTGVRFAHPWFGPLDAAQWHAMAGMHMGIHRAQIEMILDRLKGG